MNEKEELKLAVQAYCTAVVVVLCFAGGAWLVCKAVWG